MLSSRKERLQQVLLCLAQELMLPQGLKLRLKLKLLFPSLKFLSLLYHNLMQEVSHQV